MASVLSECSDRPLAHCYRRLVDKEDLCAEKHPRGWALKQLVCSFSGMDCAPLIIRDPVKYHAQHRVKNGTLLQVRPVPCPLYHPVGARLYSGARKTLISMQNTEVM